MKKMMALKLNLFIFVFSVGVHGSICDKNRIAQAFIDNEVIPDVIDVAPKLPLSIEYPQWNQTGNFGNIVTLPAVQLQPVIDFEARPDEYYTLLMVDPDAISRAFPNISEYQHWTVVNIRGSCVGNGQVLTEYISVDPPAGTGLHRYVFLVYLQPRKIAFNVPFISVDNLNREFFSARAFATRYGYGNPVAGNFFQAPPPPT